MSAPHAAGRAPGQHATQLGDRVSDGSALRQATCWSGRTSRRRLTDLAAAGEVAVEVLHVAAEADAQRRDLDAELFGDHLGRLQPRLPAAAGQQREALGRDEVERRDRVAWSPTHACGSRAPGSLVGWMYSSGSRVNSDVRPSPIDGARLVALVHLDAVGMERVGVRSRVRERVRSGGTRPHPSPPRARRTVPPAPRGMPPGRSRSPAAAPCASASCRSRGRRPACPPAAAQPCRSRGGRRRPAP